MLPGLSADELRDLSLSVGTHLGTRRLSPIEVASLFQKAMNSGATLQECAKFVRLEGTTMVSRFLKLNKISPSIKYLIDWGQSTSTISFTAAKELCGLPNDQQEYACEAIIANQLKKSEVQQVFQIYRRSKRSISDCINEVIRMRPAVERRYVFVGSIRNSSLRHHLLTLRQSDRDALLSEVLVRAYASLGLKSARLGHDLFTIVTDQGGASLLKQGGADVIEEVINKALEERISIK